MTTRMVNAGGGMGTGSTLELAGGHEGPGSVWRSHPLSNRGHFMVLSSSKREPEDRYVVHIEKEGMWSRISG